MTGNSRPPAPSRVLIIKPSSLGDVVTALPVLRALRRTFPRCRVLWMLSATCAPLVEGDADLDGVVLFDRRRLGRAWRSPGALLDLERFLRGLRKQRFDWVIDLQGLFRSGFFAWASRAPVRAGFADAREGARMFYTHSIRVSAAHAIDRNIELAGQLGIDASREDLRLTVATDARAFADETFRRLGLKRGGFVACVPPTRWSNKRYPARHWRAVAAGLSKTAPVVLLGADGDRDLCDAIADGSPRVANLAGRTTVPQFAAMIACSALVICSDSAAQYIATAVGVPALTLIGPTRVERTGPYGRGRALTAPVPCQGCLKRRCRHATCMELISPAEVLAAAEAMLDQERR